MGYFFGVGGADVCQQNIMVLSVADSYLWGGGNADVCQRNVMVLLMLIHIGGGGGSGISPFFWMGRVRAYMFHAMYLHLLWDGK